jgi:hypothetical protein
MLHYRLSNWRKKAPLNSDFVDGLDVTPAKLCSKVTRVIFEKKSRN